MANMFGALNRFMARLDSDPNNTAQLKSVSTGSSAGAASSTTAYGFQVLRNTTADLPLEPWFDFLIGINGRTIDNPDGGLLAAEFRNCAGATISLGVWSAKGQAIREIYAHIPPADGGEGLGLRLQWSPLAITDDVWHILDVMPNAPADVAGLLPYGDYVIGSPERAEMRGEAALGELVEQFLDRPLRLYVYNHEYDVTRLVTITPARNWGGDGALGCVLGYGALHRVPPPLGEPAQGPGETLFESAGDVAGAATMGAGATDAAGVANGNGVPGGLQQAAEFLVPANMDISSPSPSGGTGGATSPAQTIGKARKQRAHHATQPAGELDDYFAEGEQQSRERDIGSSSKPSNSLPPPPKGGPPRGASPATEPPVEEESNA